MRAAMVASQLRVSAVEDARVIAAMNAVPREAFVPVERVALAYTDRPVPLAGGRALNPPLSTALLLDALELRAGQRVLVIGGATGYAGAVLAAMGAEATLVEEDDALVELARRALADVEGVTLVPGPLAGGASSGALYDALLIDGAVERVPDVLADQLAEGGRAAAGLVERGVTRLAVGRKTGGVLALTDFADAETVVLPGFALARGFVF